jgi:hypothetical protein
MTAQSTPATDAARRLWARAVGDATAPEEVAAAAERTCTQLRAGLGRWIGADGYRALLDRALALALARAEHPALGDLPCLGGDLPATMAVVRAHGAGATAAGLVALVAALIELLGRIIGDEMALRLVEQIGMPSLHGVVSTEAAGGRDG